MRAKKLFKKKRTTVRRRKVFRRKRTIMDNVPHSFMRQATITQVTGNIVHAPYLNAERFDGLLNLINYTEFSNLYDQFMLTKVKVEFFMQVDPTAQTATTAFYPRLYWHRDYDDSTAPASLSDVRERGNCKSAIMRCDKPITIWCKPNVLQTMYHTGVTSAYAPKFDTWIDIATPGVPHYGFKYAIDNFTNTAYKFEIVRTFYFKCRAQR